MTATEVAKEQTWPKKGAVNDFLRHPPVEQFRTIDGLLKSHAAAADQKLLICYPKDGITDFEPYTGAQIDSYADAAVQFYIENGLEPAVCSHLQASGTPANQRRRTHLSTRLLSWLSYLPATSRF